MEDTGRHQPVSEASIQKGNRANALISIAAESWSAHKKGQKDQRRSTVSGQL